MKLRSRHWLVAGALSASIHVAAVVYLTGEQDVLIEAGEGALTPVWGVPASSMFSDVANAPSPASETVELVETPPVEVDEAQSPAEPTDVEMNEPEKADVAEAKVADATAVEAIQPAEVVREASTPPFDQPRSVETPPTKSVRSEAREDGTPAEVRQTPASPPVTEVTRQTESQPVETTDAEPPLQALRAHDVEASQVSALEPQDPPAEEAADIVAARTVTENAPSETAEQAYEVAEASALRERALASDEAAEPTLAEPASTAAAAGPGAGNNVAALAATDISAIDLATEATQTDHALAATDVAAARGREVVADELAATTGGREAPLADAGLAADISAREAVAESHAETQAENAEVTEARPETSAENTTNISEVVDAAEVAENSRPDPIALRATTDEVANESAPPVSEAADPVPGAARSERVQPAEVRMVEASAGAEVATPEQEAKAVTTVTESTEAVPAPSASDNPVSRAAEVAETTSVAAVTTPVQEVAAEEAIADEVVADAVVDVPLPRLRPKGAPPPRQTATTQRQAPKPTQTTQHRQAEQAQPTRRRQANPAPKPPSSAASAPSGRRAGGQGRAAEGVGQAARSNYSGRVASHLERRKRYPRAAERQRLSGSVKVRFTLRADGSVSGSSIVGSSGHKVLDDEVRAMLRRANPFPRFPEGIGRSSMSFTVSIRFVPR